MNFPPAPLPLSPLDLSRLPEAGLEFTWAIPGSKSITNRALALAALAEGTTVLRGVLQSDDTRYMRQGLEHLGISVTERDPTTWVVEGGLRRLRAPSEPLFVGNSGTTVRFLSGLAALVPGPVTLQGDEHMAKRPIADLVEGLRQLGVRVECETGCPPLRIWGGELPSGTATMRGDRSSQYFSALLMAAPHAQGEVTLQVDGELVSRPYVDITLEMLRRFGADVIDEGNRFVVRPGATRSPGEYVIEPDASSASYAFATATATGLAITVPGLGTSALQGDYGFVDLVEQMGARVERSANSTRVIGPRPPRGDSPRPVLRGLDVDMHHISDTVMTLAALAPLCDGVTHIRNVANIRLKETDRLAATVAELERVGQQVTSGEDWLRIEPRPVRPATIHCYSDHRMAMSFGVLGLVRPGITIEDPACVAKTYPGFWDSLREVYAAVGQAAPY
ncbi:MAG: 3-phosphoshikimate 1-carboxyvinyltransferase [Myxococcales bacterium]|jgi:3-phosphoshikimate 1-carboxyvinyltransferase|nr:3-phosphoshikimate 1-carboxyvinyltransferase [Myxococcales bacterium]